MQAKPYSHAEASEDSFRHISECIPQEYSAGKHFDLASFHALQVSRSTGQTKYEHQKNTTRHLLEGLNDQSSN